jgi:hypothetical protein
MFHSLNFELDGIQRFNIDDSYYATSDQSKASSITNAFKTPNSSEKCLFSGNIQDGFRLKFGINECVQNDVNPTKIENNTLIYQYSIKHEIIDQNNMSTSYLSPIAINCIFPLPNDLNIGSEIDSTVALKEPLTSIVNLNVSSIELTVNAIDGESDLIIGNWAELAVSPNYPNFDSKFR